MLYVYDSGNNTVQENVKVTPTTISGSGLFGTTSTVLHADVKAASIIGILNNSPEVQYSGVGKIQIFTGQMYEKYSVGGANFTTPIEIDGSAEGGLQISVGVGPTSNLNLAVHNGSHAVNSAELVFDAPGATVSPSRISLTGVPNLSGGVGASFVNGVQSVVSYTDFSAVLSIGSATFGGGGGGHQEAVLSAVAAELSELKMK
jgi:hypothetical protein